MKTADSSFLPINNYGKYHGKELKEKIVVTKVEKIYNPISFDRFTGELRRTLKKYPQKKTWELVKLLFNGTNNSNPITTLNDEYGLDNRLRQHGDYGQGIYFSNSSNYCYHNSYLLPPKGLVVGQMHSNEYQFLLCFVATGEYVQIPA